MSEVIIYFPVYFHGVESKIFKWQGFWLSCTKDAQARWGLKCRVCWQKLTRFLSICSGGNNGKRDSVRCAFHLNSDPYCRHIYSRLVVQWESMIAYIEGAKLSRTCTAFVRNIPQTELLHIFSKDQVFTCICTSTCVTISDTCCD